VRPPFRIWRAFRIRWPGLLWRMRRLGGSSGGEIDRDLATRFGGEAGARRVISVHRSRRLMRLYGLETDGWRALTSYRIGVGRFDSPTPPGEFAIQSRFEDPVWDVPPNPRHYGALAGTQIAAGDPRNRILARWMGFCPGIGIHGTRPGPLGIGASDGCILMTVPDVIDLYDRVDRGTPIIVR